jgi:hypothetical protein
MDGSYHGSTRTTGARTVALIKFASSVHLHKEQEQEYLMNNRKWTDHFDRLHQTV